jgi:PAS domain S-box-containing protein
MDDRNETTTVPPDRGQAEAGSAPGLAVLRESEARYRAFVEATGDWICEIDLAGGVRYSNPAVLPSMGYRPEEVLGRSVLDLILEEDRPKAVALFARAAAEGRGWVNEVLRFRDRDGSVRWHECTGVPIVDAAGAVAGYRGSHRDVTRRVRTELALREAFGLAANERARAESILASLPDGLSIQDHDFRVLYQNAVHVGLVGEHHGEFCYKAYQGRDSVCEGCQVAESFKDGGIHTRQRVLGDGEAARYLEISSSPMRDASGAIVAGIESVRDVTEVRRTAARLRESEQRFKELADALPEAVFECDVAGRISYVNRAALAAFGFDAGELVGADIIERIAPPDRERARAGMRGRLEGAHDRHDEYVALRRDGSTFPVLVQASAIQRDGRPVGLRGLVIDLTERKRIEAELLKTQKLESVGILAGGIAHDFNNILTGILGNISLARLRVADGDPVQGRLAEAEKASLHARELTQQLLTFARGGAPVRRPLAVEPLLRDAARFALRGTNVRLEFRIAPGLPAVEADEGQLGQVVQNLVLNACQAMPGGGTVTVGAEAVELGASVAAPLPAGRYVRLTVADQGVGIAPEHLGRIFDPYFTTKSSGSGLGLAVTYSVVHSHRGHVSVTSAPGGGSTFVIHLPATDAPPAPGEREHEAGARGRGRVLVMDDEEVVRDVAAAMLEECGYEPVAVADGGEAVRAFRDAREAGRPFDAVIVDLTVPGGMGGLRALELMRGIDPQVRAIVSSGYSNDPVMADFRGHGFAGIVTKPYRVRDLADAVQRVLAGHGAPAGA